MTDQTGTGAAATAGTAAVADATAANTGTTAATAPAWATGLETGDLEYIGSKGYKELAPLISDARHADKLKGELGDLKSKALIPPGPEAKPEELDAFYGKLGRPEKADGYEFKLPEGLPETFPYDGESAKAYKAWAHAAGLTPRQAQGLHDDFVKEQANQFTAFTAAQTAKIEAAHSELTKPDVWGEKGSPRYVENTQFADRFIAREGLLDELKAGGALSPENEVLMPKLAQTMARLGKQLYGEDQFVPGGNTPTNNPYADGPTNNRTEQMRMYRANPQQALSYIRAAGKQPSDFGLT